MMADGDDPSNSRRRSGSLVCACGAGVCLLVTSKSYTNPGRPYYRCPGANRGCGFIKWLDQVQAHELIFDIPDCACGAGICRLDVNTTGPNTGRKCFVCPIRKVDESVISVQSTLTNCSDVGSANSDLVEENGSTNLGQEIESLVHTSQCSENLVPTSGLLKRDKIMLEEWKGSEDSLDEPLRKCCKRLRHGDSNSDGSLSSSSSICRRIPLANSRNYLTKEDGRESSPTFEAEIHHRKTEFGRQISFETTLAASKNLLFSHHHSSLLPINSEGVQETSWVVAAIRQNLCLEIQGWWGRLAFPPSKSLKEPAAEPFFCCVFPSFDPIFLPPNVNLLSDGVPATPIASPLAAESSRQSLLTQSEGQLLGTQENRSMRELVLKAFAKAADQLQIDLLTRLRSLDIQDHEIMVREADATFDALDQLQVDYKIFSEQVQEYIRCASLLAKIDQSMISDHSCRMLADRFSYEKLKLDEINDAYKRAIVAFSVSEQRSASLAKEVSQLKDKLFETEAELSCSEAESTALKARTLEMSEDKERFEQSFQTTRKELEDARKQRKQIEAEKHAAKAAFEKAKISIWG